jgi:single-strand DNA-binding protein
LVADFPAMETEQEKRMYLNRITLIGFIGNDAERKKGRQRNQHRDLLARHQDVLEEQCWSLESRTEWHRCVAFGKLADFAGTLSRGTHVAVEGELRSHEYQCELAVGAQKTTIVQRIWEVRVDSVLKLDRAAKRESSEENHEEVPR